MEAPHRVHQSGCAAFCTVPLLGFLLAQPCPWRVLELPCQSLRSETASAAPVLLAYWLPADLPLRHGASAGQMKAVATLGTRCECARRSLRGFSSLQEHVLRQKGRFAVSH